MPTKLEQRRGGGENAGVENAGVENAGVESRSIATDEGRYTLPVYGP